MDSTQSRCCSFFKTDCEHTRPVGYGIPKIPSPGRDLRPLRQLTITQTLSKTRNKQERASILSLPSSVRRRVYFQAGIPYRSRLVLQPGFEYGRLGGDCYKAITSLALTCRLVCDEVTNLLFSENYFVIYHTKPGDLQRLRNFSPRVYKSLQRLELHVRFTPCKFSGGCQHRYEHTKAPLDCQSRRNIDMFYEWLSIAEHLAQHVPRRRFEIRFHCAVKTLSAAETCLEPLSNKYLSGLAECLINLRSPEIDEISNDEIATFARSVSLQYTSWKPKPPCFHRFLDLPTELQLRVLEHTDLVAPFHEVNFVDHGNGAGGYGTCCGFSRCDSIPARLVAYHRHCDPLMHHACQYYPLEYHCDVFCRRKGIDDPLCTCWAPPTALFLVNKRTRRLSQKVFFSQNRFVLSPVPLSDCLRSRDPTSFSFSVFMERLRKQQSLQWLRKLELARPTFSETSRKLNESIVLQDWASSIEAAQTQLVLSSLEITVFISSKAGHYFPSNLTTEHVDYALTQYRRELSRLSRFRGMKAFLVIATTPSVQPSWCRDCASLQVDSELLEYQTQRLGQELERLVIEDDHISDRVKKRPRQVPQRVLRWLFWSSNLYATRCACLAGY